MTLVGEFLDRPSLQLPYSSKTVALVYNAKEEAPTHAAPVSKPSNLCLHSSSSQSPQRVHDLYAEWDTLETIHAVKAALEERHRVVMIEADEAAFQKFVSLRPDFVFNISEGLYGLSREAQIPAMLEMLRIPYLGSDPQTLSICLDKGRTKEILCYHGIPTAPFSVVSSLEEARGVRMAFPSIVKPLHEGSSKGISNSCLVRNATELAREVGVILTTYEEPALIEEYLPGREFTVAVLGNGDGARCLPVVEIRFDALPAGVNPIYSYEAKWVWDSSDKPLEIFDCPAKLEPSLQEEIETICLKAFRVLRCRDWSRIDVRLDSKGRACIIEINPLPGILPKPEDNSCFPKAARAAGMSYNQLINAALDAAMDRCGVFTANQEKTAI